MWHWVTSLAAHRTGELVDRGHDATAESIVTTTQAVDSGNKGFAKLTRRHGPRPLNHDTNPRLHSWYENETVVRSLRSMTASQSSPCCRLLAPGPDASTEKHEVGFPTIHDSRNHPT